MIKDPVKRLVYPNVTMHPSIVTRYITCLSVFVPNLSSTKIFANPDRVMRHAKTSTPNKPQRASTRDCPKAGPNVK